MLALSILCIVLALIVCAGLLVRRQKKYTYADLVDFGQEAVKIEREHQERLHALQQQHLLAQFAQTQPADHMRQVEVREQDRRRHSDQLDAAKFLTAHAPNAELRSKAAEFLGRSLDD